MTTPWKERYARRVDRMGSSTIRELLKLTQRPDIISFAGGMPAPELFPVEAFREAADRVLTTHGAQALQYSTTEGYGPLREFIVQKMAKYGIEAAPENVLITSGSQQALDLVGKLFLDPGDLVLSERPTYLGAIQAWRAYQADFVTMPIDDQGLHLGDMAQALAARPKFMYILPNFQNPGGVTLALERRLELISLADSYGIPIIEDDPYGELRYEGEHIPSLLTLDAQRLEAGRLNGRDLLSGNVIYLSTFSKTLAPGIRLGWIVAPGAVIERCVMAKQGMDLHTSSFMQMVAFEVVKDGFLKQHVRRLRAVYRRRRDVMLQAMAETFPPQIQWTNPKGGLFLWVTLPEGWDSQAILEKAIARQVAFVPGRTFYPDGRGRNTLRLNFSSATSAQIERGIACLGQVLAEEALLSHEILVA